MKVNAHMFSTYNVKLLVARFDTVLPPALHQLYIYGVKFKDIIGLLVDKRHFLIEFLWNVLMHICEVLECSH